MHQYGSLEVPQTQKSCDALIEVFKFIRYVLKKSCMFAPNLPCDLLWCLWTFSSKLDECASPPSNVGTAAAHRELKSPKRFTNLPSDSSRCPGEKGRSCIKRKKKLGIQLELCSFYMFSLFHPGTHNLSQIQKKQATLCSDFRGGLWTFLAILALCAPHYYLPTQI